MAETRAAVDERRSEIIDAGVSIATERTPRLSARIDNVQRLLRELDAQLAALDARVGETRQSFPRTLNLLTQLSNLIPALVAISFLSLLAHSVSLFKCPQQSFRELVGWSGSEEQEFAEERSPSEDQKAQEPGSAAQVYESMLGRAYEWPELINL